MDIIYGIFGGNEAYGFGRNLMSDTRRRVYYKRGRGILVIETALPTNAHPPILSMASHTAVAAQTQIQKN